MQKALEFLSAPSVRRMAVFLIGLGVVALNKKLGLELDANEIWDVVLLSIAMFTQSAVREGMVAHADAKVALAEAAGKAAAPAPVPAQP
jgi:hypothetical protein